MTVAQEPTCVGSDADMVHAGCGGRMVAYTTDLVEPREHWFVECRICHKRQAFNSSATNETGEIISPGTIRPAHYWFPDEEVS